MNIFFFQNTIFIIIFCILISYINKTICIHTFLFHSYRIVDKISGKTWCLNRINEEELLQLQRSRETVVQMASFGGIGGQKV